MNVDKDLFMYNLAAVALVHNEAPYIAEWIDYHLLAGVDHFLIYDNDGNDNLKEILTHYIRHQEEVVTRRTKFDLAKAKARAHILEGLTTAVKNLDVVIRLKESLIRIRAN